MNKEKMLKIARWSTWLLCILWVVLTELMFAMTTNVYIYSVYIFVNNIISLAMLGLLLVHLVFGKWLYFFISLVFFAGSLCVSSIIDYCGCSEAGRDANEFVIHDYFVEENVEEKLKNEEKQVETIKQEDEEKQEETIEQKDECFANTGDLTTDELEELRKKGCFKDTEKLVESETIEQKQVETLEQKEVENE
ncbi:MAG: hypothetical protein J6W96_00230 [Alphaproteobacteria bacterium]|nr:hypothetical protein [Alphaproteobacteria bacterium]